MKFLVALLLVAAGCITPVALQEDAADVRVIAYAAEGEALRAQGFWLTEGAWMELRCEQACSHNYLDIRGSAVVDWYFVWDPTLHSVVSGPADASIDPPHETGFANQRGTISATDTEVSLGNPTDGSFWLRLRGHSDELLPNLVELVPDDIEFTTPMLGVPETYCGADEMIDTLARKCLRLNNAVGNVGDGPFEVRMTTMETAQGAVVETDIWQRIYTLNGTEDLRAGKGQFHPTHGHMHVKDLASYNLYAWDADGQTMGDSVALGTKQGFCLMDWEPMNHTEVVDGVYGGQGCDLTMQDLYMGVSVGWADLYWNTLPGQYIDVSDLPDGTYLLMAQVAPFFIETDPHDNQAAVLLSIAGNSVEVHQEFGYHWRL